jgi:hypothetical protein
MPSDAIVGVGRRKRRSGRRKRRSNKRKRPGSWRKKRKRKDKPLSRLKRLVLALSRRITKKH